MRENGTRRRGAAAAPSDKETPNPHRQPPPTAPAAASPALPWLLPTSLGRTGLGPAPASPLGGLWPCGLQTATGKRASPLSLRPCRPNGTHSSEPPARSPGAKAVFVAHAGPGGRAVLTSLARV